jgi:hypothetical protein
MLGWDSTNGWTFSWIGAVLLAVATGFALRRSGRKHRRRDSLRREDGGGYVWIELDGSRRRSDTDPRDQWDKDDADDSDGDGD